MNNGQKALLYKLGSGWYEKLKDVFQTPELKATGAYLKERAAVKSEGFPPREVVIIPEKKDWFKAFRLTPFSDVRVVILGQSPYNKLLNGQAVSDGLAWSSAEPFDVPEEVTAIFEELEEDVHRGLLITRDPDFTRWASQGVLMLNKTLTCEGSASDVHGGIGWDLLTRTALSLLLEDSTPKIFVAWGKENAEFLREALKISENVGENEHFFLKAGYPVKSDPTLPDRDPSDFRGSQHFSQINMLLKDLHNYTINW